MVIESMQWQGDRDGHLTLRWQEESDEVVREVDRLGDLLVLLYEKRFEDSELGVAGAFGLVLSTRKVTNPLFVRQTLDRAIRHIAACDPVSVPLYRTMERFRKILGESDDLSATELRDHVLAETRRLQDEVSGS